MSFAFSIKNLSYRYPGEAHALRDITLSLPRGRALALLGANGAGKSTLIGAILGLRQPLSEGYAELLGVPSADITPEVFKRVALVADGRTPPDHWTLGRLIAYLKPYYDRWDDEFCERLVRKFALPKDKLIGGFSRGMKMKAAMLVALAARPELLVLDEPFGGLDPLTRDELIEGLLELMQGGEWSVLLSSHDIHEVERLCDGVALLERGRLTLHEDMDSLQTRHRRWYWSSSDSGAKAPVGWFDFKAEDGRFSAMQSDFESAEKSLEILSARFSDLRDVRDESTDLRAIFVARMKSEESAKSSAP